MTLEEAEVYLKSNANRETRFPKKVSFAEEDKKTFEDLQSLIFSFFTSNDPIVRKWIKSCLLKHPWVEYLKKKTFERRTVYYIKTKYASGYFFDAHYLADNNKYPFYISHNGCFGNAIGTCIAFSDMGIPSKMQSGIVCTPDNSELHCVTLAKRKSVDKEPAYDVIDFNFDIVMSKKLYDYLMSFEVLNEIDSKQVNKDYDYLSQALDLGCTFSYASYCLANKDFVERTEQVKQGKVKPFTLTTWNFATEQQAEKNL